MEKTKLFKVAILTPYLSRDLGTIENDFERFKQKEFYGWEEKNLSDTDYLKTQKGNIVQLQKTPYEGKNKSIRNTLDSEEVKHNEFAIAGSTKGGEREISLMKGSGIIVARYSIFYGELSEYTGRSPESTGYSLDIPKNVRTVKELLRSDETLEALASRDEQGIIKALEELNQKLDQPILTTPYLSKALES